MQTFKESHFIKYIKKDFFNYQRAIIGFGGAVTVPKGVIKAESNFDELLTLIIKHNLVVVPHNAIILLSDLTFW